MKTFLNDVFVMKNTIKLSLNSSSYYHSTLARLEDEIAMNLAEITHIHEIHLKGCIYDGKHHQHEDEFIVLLLQYSSSTRGRESDEFHSPIDSTQENS